MSPLRRVQVLLISAFFAAALGCGSAPGTGGPDLRLSLHSPAGSQATTILVSGLSGAERAAVREAALDEAAWEALLRVTVASASSDSPAVKGRYAVNDEGVVFTPVFPFDAGRSYLVSFDPSRLPRPRGGAVVSATLTLPATASSPTTHVVAIHPAADVVPENLLRVYIEFSAPMGSNGARDFVRLIDLSEPRERVVEDAFLPVEADFWSPDHRRYTLFLDPGRVKDGILPNRERGRPLRAGRQYALEIDAAWTDANRQPLTAAYRHPFRASGSVAGAIRLADWTVTGPLAGTRDRLIVTFARPLDHAVAIRALGVERAGRAIAGTGAIDTSDTRWTFMPGEAWTAGAYDLTAQSFLEDPQGNQIDAPFEEIADTPRPEGAVDVFRLPFKVASPR